MHLPYWPDNRPYTDSRKYFTFMCRQIHPLLQIVAERTEIIVAHRFSFVAQIQVLYRGRRFSAHIDIVLFNGFSTIRTIGFPAGIIILHAFCLPKDTPCQFFRYIHYEYTVPAGGPLSNIPQGFLHTVSLYKYVLPLPDLSAKKESAYTQWCCHPGHTTHNSGLLRRL